MPRFKLTVEYAGTKYSGWQIQKNARTVQGEIDRAVRTITSRMDFELYGSGSTDAGVHALAQVAHLDVATNLPPDTLVERLNGELPADINILDAVVVPHRFHARHDAVARRYLYQIARRRTAFAKAYVWWVKDALKVDRMRRAADAFVGFKDFGAFAESDGRGDAERSTDVRLDRLDIGEADGLVLVAVEGSHFLWKMVRRIVGVLVEIGRGRLEPDAAARLMTDSTDVPARLTAPASGLFLERVYYKDDPRDHHAQAGHAAAALVDCPSYLASSARSPVRRQFGPQHETHDANVAGRAVLDTIRLQILIVDAPSGGRHRRVDVARETIRQRAQILTRTGREARGHLLPIASRTGCRSARRRATTTRCTAPGPAPVQARQPADEVGFAFIGKAGEVAPLVGDDERALERQKIARDERFEKKRIGHPGDGGRAEIPVEQRSPRTTRERWYRTRRHRARPWQTRPRGAHARLPIRPRAQRREAR